MDERRLRRGRSGGGKRDAPERGRIAPSSRRHERRNEEDSANAECQMPHAERASSLAFCIQHLALPVGSFSNRLEREAEHDLCDPHEPGLNGGLAEVRVAHRVRALQRAHVDPIEQIQLFDLQLRHPRPGEAEVLDEHRIDVGLDRGPH